MAPPTALFLHSLWTSPCSTRPQVPLPPCLHCPPLLAVQIGFLPIDYTRVWTLFVVHGGVS